MSHRRNAITSRSEYLVRWEGYPDEEASCEPRSRLEEDGFGEELKAFHAKDKREVRRASGSLPESLLAKMKRKRERSAHVIATPSAPTSGEQLAPSPASNVATLVPTPSSSVIGPKSAAVAQHPLHAPLTKAYCSPRQPSPHKQLPQLDDNDGDYLAVMKKVDSSPAKFKNSPSAVTGALSSTSQSALPKTKLFVSSDDSRIGSFVAHNTSLNGRRPRAVSSEGVYSTYGAPARTFPNLSGLRIRLLRASTPLGPEGVATKISSNTFKSNHFMS